MGIDAEAWVALVESRCKDIQRVDDRDENHMESGQRVTSRIVAADLTFGGKRDQWESPP